MSKFIELTGAREHNLKNIDVQIPRHSFTVVTGLSGSGKSSLAFDTIYAEGNRRYVESLSPYARQFLERMKKPELDRITGLSPSISIEQKHTTRNPRSTVGTVTEIFDFLRLLFAKIGHIHCHQCGQEVKQSTKDQIEAQVESLGEGKKLTIYAPIVRERKGLFKDVIEDVRKAGYSKVRIDGDMLSLADEIKLLKSKRHNIDVVVNRILSYKENIEEIKNSVRNAMDLANGVCEIEIEGKGKKKNQSILFSEKLFCVPCQIGFEELTPNMFSFNSTLGACPTCHGIGITSSLSEKFIIKNEDKPLLQGALNKEINFSFNKYFIHDLVYGLKDFYSVDITKPYKDLPDTVKEAFFYGNKEYNGVIDELKALQERTESVNVKRKVQRFLKEETCKTCGGGRLRQESLGVQIHGKNIVDLSNLSLGELNDYFSELKLTRLEMILTETILKEIKTRLHYLSQMGLDYLTLSRRSSTLSGGEIQRVRLASQIGTGLSGVLYVLDEPSIGLHARDNDKLISILKDLRKLNNTVLVVEHDEATMLAADHLIDLGPGAGEHGGEILFSRPNKDILKKKEKKSITLQYLNKEKVIPVPKKRIEKNSKHIIQLKQVTQHNLKKVSVDIPLGLLTCVTGVSGSGKSTLIHDVLYKVVKNSVYKTDDETGSFKDIKGLELIDKVIEIDQTPIGRTSRSNPATYVDIMSHIRKLFASLPDSKVKGFSPGRFSFNVKGGRCEACEGAGVERLEMSFLPDVSVVCDVCRGKRYNQETLTILYREKNIADILDMPISDALDFFDAVPQIRTRLEVLEKIGLGYLRLGQPSPTLSGGEAQRIKIGDELCKKSTGKTLYILDEPTTGLHFADIEKLMHALLGLREQGNTVIIVEHNLDVIKMADYIIDLGPEGGDEGGEVVAAGSPEEVAKNPKSYTGQYLKPHLTA